jgi:hypothetical protein
MKTPLPLRAKLIAAAGSLLVPLSFDLFHNIARRGEGEIVFRVGCFILGVFLGFGGVFGNAQLQVFWGWGLAITAPLLTMFLLLGFVPGSDVLWTSASVLAAFVGGYILLLDADVRDYRCRIKRKHRA